MTDHTDQTTQLSCQELVELVTDYVEGALSPEEHVRFEAHISRCDGCGVYLEQMRMTVRILGNLPVAGLPAGAERDLLDAFRDWR
jgi:anti-sigma factor RsiW